MQGTKNIERTKKQRSYDELDAPAKVDRRRDRKEARAMKRYQEEV